MLGRRNGDHAPPATRPAGFPATNRQQPAGSHATDQHGLPHSSRPPNARLRLPSPSALASQRRHVAAASARLMGPPAQSLKTPKISGTPSEEGPQTRKRQAEAVCRREGAAVQPATSAAAHNCAKSASSSHTARTGPAASVRKPHTADSRSRSAVHQVDTRNCATSCSTGASKLPSRRLFCQNFMNSTCLLPGSLGMGGYRSRESSRRNRFLEKQRRLPHSQLGNSLTQDEHRA